MISKILPFVFLAFAVVGVIQYLKFRRRMAATPSLPTDRLWESVEDERRQLLESNQALEELQRRGEDMSPAIVPLARMMLSDNYVIRLIGQGKLQELFPELLEGLDYDLLRPKPDQKVQLEKLIAEASR